jgi:uncharacterized protein (TIGR02611 family)
MRRSLIRKTAVGTAGAVTVATGIVLLPLPGPGTLIIIGGLALLSREFPAAARLLDRAKDAGRRVTGRTPQTD